MGSIIAGVAAAGFVIYLLGQRSPKLRKKLGVKELPTALERLAAQMERAKTAWVPAAKTAVNGKQVRGTEEPRPQSSA